MLSMTISYALMLANTYSAMLFVVILEDLVLPDLITVALGLLSPLVIQFIKNRFAGKTARFYISLLLSAAIGFIAYALKPPEVRDPVAFVATVFGYATLAYKGFWKPLWDTTFLGNYFLKGKR